MKTKLYTSALLVSLTTICFAGETCSKSSPVHTIALLELYTSEGCDSCPPADKAVQQLQVITGLTSDEVIPIALHVNYWDYIGWKDPYAQVLHTQRQQDLARLSHARGVYTPGFFINGHELQNWRTDLINDIKNINQQQALANVRLSVSNVTQRLLQVETESSSQQAGVFHVVLIENSLVSNVKAGENKDAVLRHDAVVRSWANSIKLMPGIKHKESVELVIPTQSNRKKLAVVGFIENQNGEVMQSLLLPFCNPQN